MEKILQKISSAKQISFKILCMISFTLVILSFVYPIFNILVKVIIESKRLNDAKFFLLNYDKRLFKIAFFTIYQAFISAVIATLLGLVLAYFCAKKDFVGRRFLLSLAAIPVAVPTLLVALSYVFFFGRAGILNSFYFLFSYTTKNFNGNFLYSFFAVITIHSFYNFPLALKTITNVWECIDVDLENAAILLSKNKVLIFFKIVLPEIFPAILSSFLLIFIYCFFSFLIILLFGGIGLTTLEVELYQVSRFSVNFIDSVKVAFLETIFALGIVVAYIFFKFKTYKNVTNNRKIKVRTKMNTFERIVFFILFSLTIIFLIAPLFSIFLKSIFSFEVKNSNASFFEKLKAFFKVDFSHWKILFSVSTLKAIFNTIIIGLVTACISVLTAVWVIYFDFKLKLNSKKNLLLKILPFLPLVISSVVLGFAIRVSFSVKGIFAFLLLVFAQSSRCWPICYTQLNEGFLQIPKTLMQASVLLSKNNFDAFYRVVLPIIKKNVFTGFAFSFAISAGDASLPLVLRIPKFQNLSLMILRLAGSYRFPESAILGFILVLIVCGAFFTTKDKIVN